MKNISILFILPLLILSCKSDPSGILMSPVSGYGYKILKDTDARTGQVGEHVYFKMSIYDDKDSLLQSYQNQKILPSVKLVNENEITRRKNPILDIASLMSVGDSFAILVPIDSVSNLPSGYDDVEHIEYHIAVTEILTADQFQARIDEQQRVELEEMERMRDLLPDVEKTTGDILSSYKNGELDLKETPNGVKYMIHELGTGEMPTKDRMVTITYYGRTVADGNTFDNSYKRGRGYSFRLGRGEVIRGWDEAALYLPVGTVASLFIPSELGYGAVGSPPNIPPDAELYFYVTVDEMYY